MTTAQSFQTVRSKKVLTFFSRRLTIMIQLPSFLMSYENVHQLSMLGMDPDR